MAVPIQKPKAVHHVVWAIDPFHDSPSNQLVAGQALKSMHPTTELKIQPVSLLLAGKYDKQSQYFLETWSELESIAQKNLKSILQGFSIPGLLEPVLIRQPAPSHGSAVNALIKFALDENADEILVSSHGRSGTARFLMGSFAESLVLKSPLPTLVVNPKVHPSGEIKHILFPTDFCDKSRVAFERVVDLAAESRAGILLFHKLRYLYPEFGYPFVVPNVSIDSLKNFEDAALSQANEWALWGENHGVNVRAHVSSKAGYALDEILRISEKLGSSGMIAMASQSGPIASVILGSLTRQVLREAPCPVLVIHPHQDSLIEKTMMEMKQSAYTYAQKPLMA